MACPTERSLFDNKGTNKVFGKEKEGNSVTFLAPVIGYVTLLAFAIHVCFGWVNTTKSFLLKVIWLVAPELII